MTGREELAALVDSVEEQLRATHVAREKALPLCRRVIQQSASSIRSIHRLEPERAADFAGAAEADLRAAQEALASFPSVAHAGFLHDAAKEYVEARLTAALVEGTPLPGADDLGVPGAAWLNGLAEAASELRRHLLDRLREGELDRGEELLERMDEVYDVLVGIDFPDAVTSGLRRTVDALRAVVERTRGDVTTTALQVRLQRALEETSGSGG